MPHFMRLTSLVLSLCFFSLSQAAELVDKTVAIVNNEAILASDLKALNTRLSNTAMLDELLLQDLSLDQLRKNKDLQLNFLIDERLMDSEIRRQNLLITMERVDQEIKDLAKRNGLSKAEMMAAVKKQGVLESDYQNFIKTRIERQSLVDQEIASKIRISDDDVFAFYLSRTGKKIERVYEYNLSHILFSPKDKSGDEALERANTTYFNLKKGQDFEKLAEANSDEEYTKGAPLGIFKSKEFSAEFESAVSSLIPGEFSKIVQSRAGFHILRLNSKKEIVDPAFEKEKNRFRDILFEQTLKQQLKSWLEVKREEALIKINERK